MKRVIHIMLEQDGQDSVIYMAEYFEPGFKDMDKKHFNNEVYPESLKGKKIVDAYYGKPHEDLILEVE